jgi:hypothetical protein
MNGRREYTDLGQNAHLETLYFIMGKIKVANGAGVRSKLLYGRHPKKALFRSFVSHNNNLMAMTRPLPGICPGICQTV